MSADAVFGAEVIKVREGARALLVGSDIKRKKYKTLKASWDVASSLDELGRLCETAGLEVMGRTTQAMQPCYTIKRAYPRALRAVMVLQCEGCVKAVQ